MKKLVKALKNADWKENIDVDIAPPDYKFTWNDFDHYMWKNEKVKRLELLINGQSNYGMMSEASSKKVLEILIGD